MTSADPSECATVLPDKLVVKMPLETAQMLAVTMGSKYGLGLGELPKVDGTPYSDQAHAHHPCTRWARNNIKHMSWLVRHGLYLCAEYRARYHRMHACLRPIQQAMDLLITHKIYLDGTDPNHTPDEWAVAVTEDVRIVLWAAGEKLARDNVFLAYQTHLRLKPWVAGNYLRMPERKPEWLNTTKS